MFVWQQFDLLADLQIVLLRSFFCFCAEPEFVLGAELLQDLVTSLLLLGELQEIGEGHHEEGNENTLRERRG